jgi:hypothetical protein
VLHNANPLFTSADSGVRIAAAGFQSISWPLTSSVEIGNTDAEKQAVELSTAGFSIENESKNQPRILGSFTVGILQKHNQQGFALLVEFFLCFMVAGDVILAVNSGGSKLEDAPTGFEFAEDGFFSGGDVLRTEEHISGAQEPCLYQTARYGDLSYSFKDLAAGNYVVDLHFAEIIFTNGPPGMRVFDVLLQGKKVAVFLSLPTLNAYGIVSHSFLHWMMWVF